MATRYQVPEALRHAAQAVGATRGRMSELQRNFDRSPIPMSIVDNDRRHLEANAAARLLFRMPLSELRQLRIEDLTAEQNLPALQEAWDELIERGTVSDRYTVTFKDGSTLVVFYAAIANALPGQHLIVFVPTDWPGDELEELQPAVDSTVSERLSPRQVDVLRLVALGANVSQIAQELSISEATVKTHVKNILHRLGARNRAHAVALAMRNGLLGDYDPAELVRAGLAEELG